MGHWPSVEIAPEAVLFDDDDLIALDKAPGVLCDASIDPKREHLGTALQRWASDPDAAFFPAHRLDKATSGVVLFARNRAAATALMHQFQERSVSKQYLAICEPASQEDWEVGQKINRRSYLRHRKGISEEVRSGGKSAESNFEILAIDGELSLVRALPQTGRTHQLRVHLAALDAPILGDERYGTGTAERMWLHAEHLTFTHPATGEPTTVRSRRSLVIEHGQPHERTLS